MQRGNIMAIKPSSKKQTPICQYLPGFAFYDNFGSKLAEDVYDLVEAVLEFFNGLRRFVGNRRQH
jgi:hypothetical protein